MMFSQSLSVSDNTSKLLYRASSEESHLFNLLLYFDIFKHPLLFHEIFNLGKFDDHSQAQKSLNTWVLEGVIVRHGPYYMLAPHEGKISLRHEGEERARKMLRKGIKKARLIEKFPFVRAVFFSGSISKGVVAHDGDVDFFMITEPGRLWVCRLLLALYKKIFLLGSHKYFCINYFIDSCHLEIEEQNRFTAMELATLIPVCGDGKLMEEFFIKNDWVRKFFPNYVPQGQLISHLNKNSLKVYLERLINLMGGAGLNNLARKVTTAFLKIKFRYMDHSDFKVALKSKDYVSKHHPRYFQKFVLNNFDKKVQEFEQQYQIIINR